MNDYFRFTALDGSTHVILGDPDKVRAFFQAERDETLGRWRDPENPDTVCYLAKEDSVYVFNERTGNKAFYWLRDSLPARLWLKGAERDSYETARRYFETHPEPKPWEGAEPGEFWILTVDEKTNPYKIWTDTQRVRRFERVERPYTAISLNDPRITAGRRVWPEGEDK